MIIPRCIRLLVAFAMGASSASAESAFHLGGGIRSTVNDLYTQSRGGGVVVDYRPKPQLVLEFLGSKFANTGSRGWNPLLIQLDEENHVSPLVSLPSSMFIASTRLQVVHSQTNEVETNIGLQLGLGLIRTKDDLEAMQKSDDPSALETQHELHRIATAGIVGEVWKKQRGVQFRWEQTRHVETFGDAVETQTRTLLSANLVRGF